jgi:hypothetical protein
MLVPAGRDDNPALADLLAVVSGLLGRGLRPGWDGSIVGPGADVEYFRPVGCGGPDSWLRLTALEGWNGDAGDALV